MKILVLANFGMGLYNFRKELLEELINQNHEVYVSLPRDEYSNKFENMGCKFINTKIDRRGNNPFADFKLLLQYVKIIKSKKPDVILTYTIKPNIYGGIASRITNTPIIANITGLGTAVENPSILQKVTLALYKISLKNAKCVFFQNEENRNFFLEHKIVSNNHDLLPGSGVNIEEFTYLEYPSEETIRFLFISRVMKEKGIDQYLEAAIHIKNKYDNLEFHVVGFCEEEYEEKLNELQDEQIIIYHGRQSDVQKFYKISHCIIHPTYYPEGMSNVLLESAASGRPIITTNRSGCREIVNNLLNGYIIEQKNSVDLINKIESFISLNYEEKEKMGINGRFKVENEFPRNKIVKKYIELINQLQKYNV